MTAQDLHWYIARDQQQYGPISDAELNKFCELGHLEPYDLLWREGLPNWYPVLCLLHSRGPVVQQASIKPDHSRDVAVDRTGYTAAEHVSTLRALSANSLVALLFAMAAIALYAHYPILIGFFLSP